jgi:hypothetical protein
MGFVLFSVQNSVADKPLKQMVHVVTTGLGQ